MNILKKTMEEVLLSYKEIIEKQVNEIFELKEKQNKIENILNNLGIRDDFDDFISFISFLYENKKEFMEFINIKKNKILDNQLEELKINNLSNNEDIKDSIDNRINIAVNDALNEQKVIFDDEIQKRDNEYKTLYNNFNKLKEDFSILKNKKGIPTPTSSKENKKRDKINYEKIKLHDNIFEIVYYRNVNNNKFLPDYFINDNKYYLRCCNSKCIIKN